MLQLTRDEKWRLRHTNLENNINKIIKIRPLNTRSLPSHIDHIVNDYDLLHSDIICLQATHTF